MPGVTPARPAQTLGVRLERDGDEDHNERSTPARRLSAASFDSAS